MFQNQSKIYHFHTMRGNNEFIYRTFAFQSVWNKLLQNINIHVSYTRFKHLLNISCYPMLWPLDMTNSSVLLLVFLRIMCHTHPLPFPFLLSKMTFYYLSFYKNYIIDTVLHNIILQFLCYIFKLFYVGFNERTYCNVTNNYPPCSCTQLLYFVQFCRGTIFHFVS